MLDFILGLFLAAMLVRGWARGFVREALDLVALVIGLWIAFKLSAPLGDFLTKSFSVTPEVARIGAGIALFFLFGVAMSVAAHYLSKVMNLPGLSMVNRVGGSAVAVGWGIALILVAVNVARVFPLPDAWETQLDESSVVEAIAGADAVPQQLFESLAGDNVLGALAAIQDIFGTSRAVPGPGEILEIPKADADGLRQVRDEAETIAAEINEYRTGLGLRALLQTEPLDDVAEAQAVSSYTTGRLFLDADCLAKMSEEGIHVVRCGQSVALAGTALGAFDGISESAVGQIELANPDYDRVGVSVVDGPTGRLVVIYFGG